MDQTNRTTGIEAEEQTEIISEVCQNLNKLHIECDKIKKEYCIYESQTQKEKLKREKYLSIISGEQSELMNTLSRKRDRIKNQKFEIETSVRIQCQNQILQKIKQDYMRVLSDNNNLKEMVMQVFNQSKYEQKYQNVDIDKYIQHINYLNTKLVLTQKQCRELKEENSELNDREHNQTTLESFKSSMSGNFVKEERKQEEEIQQRKKQLNEKTKSIHRPEIVKICETEAQRNTIDLLEQITSEAYRLQNKQDILSPYYQINQGIKKCKIRVTSSLNSLTQNVRKMACQFRRILISQFPSSMNLLPYDEWITTPSRAEGVCLIQVSLNRWRESTVRRLSPSSLNSRNEPDQINRSQLHLWCTFTSLPAQGAVCVFLAGKVKYMPLRLEHAVKVFYELEFKLQYPTQKKTPPISQGKQHHYKEQFKLKEIEILEALGFDMDTHLPYEHLSSLSSSIGETVSQIASNFLNDSFIGPYCLYYHPKVITSACIQLATIFLTKKQIPFTLPTTKDGLPWYKLIDECLEEDLINEVKNQIKQVYSS